MRTFTYIMTLSLMLGAYILLVMGSVMTHEHIHQTIYESYNISSRVEYNWNLLYDPRLWFDDDTYLGVTYGERACPTEFCEIQHNMLEFLEYGLQIITGLFLITGIFIISIMHYRRSDRKLDEWDKKLEQLKEDYPEYTLIDYGGVLYLERDV